MIEALSILIIVLADRITKYLAVEFIKPKGYIPIIQDVLHLTYVENPGASFGMLSDHRWVFMSISAAAIVALIVILIVRRNKISLMCGLSLAFIVGGGIGNMIDRIAYKYVIDFIDFTLIDFAVFNAADSFVVIGTVMLAICIIFIQEEKVEK